MIKNIAIINGIDSLIGILKYKKKTWCMSSFSVQVYKADDEQYS